ncbi:winged helix-turn-helix domain-containing protein [Pikeienuella sp. HZG-20]|uniref:winged helix-turn-helix domain-containing protein n=1 Tax=Paludibacillus litoralis TaxID=3133267 RepID=UPI0030ED51D3
MVESVKDRRLKLRVVFDPIAMVGPGRVDLLEFIQETGSISAAGRRMGMSYKRAWSLVEAMNAIFRAPLVESTRGGAKGGGAALTRDGETVLAAYRRIEIKLAEAAAPELGVLTAMLGDMSGGR